MATTDKPTSKTSMETGKAPSAADAVRQRYPWRWLATIVVVLFLAQFVVVIVTNPKLQFDVVAKYMFYPAIMRGLGMTLWLTVLAMIVGFILGALLALCRMGSVPPLRIAAATFTWLFRSLPTLVVLVFLYNLAILLPRLSIGLPFLPPFWSWETNSVITPFTAAVIGLGFHKAAYMSEIIRAGLLSVGEGQRQASMALGMGYTTTLRRIILPQAMRVIIPPTGSEIISTLKLTALVSVISMSDLLYSVEAIYNRTFQTIPLLIVACLWYLIVTSVLQFMQRYVERHFSKGFGAAEAPSKEATRIVTTAEGG